MNIPDKDSTEKWKKSCDRTDKWKKERVLWVIVRKDAGVIRN